MALITDSSSVSMSNTCLHSTLGLLVALDTRQMIWPSHDTSGCFNGLSAIALRFVVAVSSE